MVGDAEGEASLGEVLPDDMLVQVGDEGLGRRDRGEPFFSGGSHRGRCGFGDRLGRDLGEGSGCTDAADAGCRLEAAHEERDVMGKQKSQETVWSDMRHPSLRRSGPPTMGGRIPHSGVSDATGTTVRSLGLVGWRSDLVREKCGAGRDFDRTEL